MVRSRLGASGVIFTLDTESGHRGVVLVTAQLWPGRGHGAGAGRPRPVLRAQGDAARRASGRWCGRRLAARSSGWSTARRHRRVRDRCPRTSCAARCSLTDDEVLELAQWALRIEEHYSKRPGATRRWTSSGRKDGESGQLFVLQARPETVHSQPQGRLDPHLQAPRQGRAARAGPGGGRRHRARARARVITSTAQFDQFKPGEILVTENTDPGLGADHEDGRRHRHRAGRAHLATRPSSRASWAFPRVVGTGNATERVERAARSR